MSHPSPTREGVVHWTVRCEHPDQALGATCAACGELVVDELCELCDAEARSDVADFTATGAYEIAGRGTCFAVVNPGGYPEPNVLTGAVVRIDGVTFKVRGVETFAIGRPYPEHLSFALLVDTTGPEVEQQRFEPLLIQGRTIGCSQSVPLRPFAFPFVFPSEEIPMDIHQQYKLTEAVNRLLLAGAEIIELADGRVAVAIPADVHPEIISEGLNPSPLEVEVLQRAYAEADVNWHDPEWRRVFVDELLGQVPQH
jgi:hypothetical protein